jgi:hypothetical protein
LAPPDSQLPAAGICGDEAGAFVVFTINLDSPSPRCGRAVGSQRVQVTNRTDTTIDVQIAGFKAQLKPGATEIIGPPVNQYLAAGVHVVHTSAYGGTGPELWVAGPGNTTAVAVKDGRIVELDITTGKELGTLYTGAQRATAPVSVRRVDGKAVVFTSVENPTGKCETPILQIADGSATDLGIVGVRPTVSPDGSVLAYVTMSEGAAVSGTFCPLNTLAVRNLANRTERRWTIEEGESFSALVWSPSGEQLFYQLRSETFLGDLAAVDAASAPVGALRAAGATVNLALEKNEWVESPRRVAEGIFVTVWCCIKANDGPGTRTTSAFGVLTSSGLRRIASPVAPPSVVAVDPSASTLIVYDVATSELSTVRVDGTNKIKIGDQPWVVTF